MQIPAPEEEIEQHIVIHRNGRVWVSRYVFGDWDENGHKKKSGKWINIGDKAEIILDQIAAYFHEPYSEVFVTDVGLWEAELINTDGEKISFHGPIVIDLYLDDVSLSELVRRELGMNDLFMFDGCPEWINRITLEYSRMQENQTYSPSQVASRDRVNNYNERLVIDRESGTICYYQELQNEYYTEQRYRVKDDLRLFLDELYTDMFLEDTESNHENAIPNQNATSYYTLTVESNRRAPMVVNGIYDRRGLPSDWEFFIAGLKDLLEMCGKSEIFNASVYGKPRRYKDEFIFLSVAFDGYKKKFYYLTDDDKIDVGDRIIVPAGANNIETEVTVVDKEFYQAEDVPRPVEQVKWIIGKCEH